MRLKYLFILLLLNHLYSNAQYKVEYNYIIRNGDVNSGSGIIIKSYLFTDGVNSKFVKDKVIAGKTESEKLNADAEFLEKLKSMKSYSPGDSIGYVIIKNIHTDTISSRLLNSKNEYVKVIEKNSPTITIVEEFKTVFNYKCQKAIMNFGERVFETWFTPDIPISDGPWKIKGLPGMVVSATTIDGTHQFEITGIQKINSLTKNFFNFPYTKVMSKKDYIDDFVSSREKKFRYQKSKLSDGSVLKTTINNLDIPIINFE